MTVGEIDLVALKGKRLAFIEVKRRRTAEDAAWTVPAKQRRRIVRAAQYWASAHRQRLSRLTPRNSPLARLCL
jgi:putative endonuclease